MNERLIMNIFEPQNPCKDTLHPISQLSVQDQEKSDSLYMTLISCMQYGWYH